jgi:ribosomal protein S18 acetylase RimI-like enzyme
VKQTQPVVWIRRTRPDDAGDLATMIRSLSLTSAFGRFLAGVSQPSAGLVQLMVRRGPQRGAWVATDGDAIVGHAMWAVADGVVDAGVVVADNWQGRGLGRRLFRAAIAEAGAAGAIAVNLDVHSSNRRVVGMLRRALRTAEISRDGALLTFRARLADVLGGFTDQPRSASRATSSLSSAPNQGSEPAAAFSRAASGREVAGIATWHRESLSTHLSSACGQVRTPNGCNGSSAPFPTEERSNAPSPKGRMTITPSPRSRASGRIRRSTARSRGL